MVSKKAEKTNSKTKQPIEKNKSKKHKVVVPSKKENSTSFLDILIWLIVIGILGGLIYVNQTYQEQLNDFVRALIGFGAVIIAAFMAGLTQKGRKLAKLLKEAFNEIIKVEWPTSNDTVKTTSVIILIVAIVALFFWLFDFLVSWLIVLLLGI